MEALMKSLEGVCRKCKEWNVKNGAWDVKNRLGYSGVIECHTKMYEIIAEQKKYIFKNKNIL